MMRLVTIAVLLSTALAAEAWGQAPPEVRRVVRTSFPFAVTPSVGFGFGATRGKATDPIQCADRPCVPVGDGSGWQARLEMQVPIGRTLGFEIGGQLGRQSIKLCPGGSCTAVDHMWAYKGSALLLWRFKPRAPVFFGVGGALAHFSSNPIYLDSLPTTEPGAAGVIGLDLAVGQRLGLRVEWRSFFLVPKSFGDPQRFQTSSVAWEQALTFGARCQLGT
jgi:hypothetical protein